MRQSPLNGGEIQPGRLGLVLLLCSDKTFEGSLIILSRLMCIFSWIFIDLFIALYGEMIYLNSSKIHVNQTGLYPT